MSATLAPPALMSRRCFGTMHGTAYGLADACRSADGKPPWIEGGRLRLAGTPDVAIGSGVNVSAPSEGRVCTERSYADEIVCGRWSTVDGTGGNDWLAVTKSTSRESLSAGTCTQNIFIQANLNHSDKDQGVNSPVLVKFPDFSRYFPQRHWYLLNNQRSTDIPTWTPEWLLWHYLSPCVCQLYLTVLRLCLFCDYHNCSSTPQANYNFPDFSLTNIKFPDFSRYSKRPPWK